jgi:hypothetical protein
MKKSFILFFAFIFNLVASAQQDPFPVVRYEVIDGDTVPIYALEEFIKKEFKDSLAEKRFQKLVRDVKKALPYAKLAAFRLQMLNDNLNLIKGEKAREEYIKKTETAIKDEFMNDLKGLSRTQGDILIKLIHRETGQTSYEVLKNYRGNATTFFWQAIAKTYGTSLKNVYDPVEQYQIEYIIKAFHLE